MEKLVLLKDRIWFVTLKYYTRFLVYFGGLRPRNINWKHEVGLLSFTKNEGTFILEWLIYHIKVVKVDHIILVDNNHVLSDYSFLTKDLKAHVTIRHDSTPFIGVGTQVRLINKYFKSYSKDFKWLGVIDTDEFIFFPNGNELNFSLKAYLSIHNNVNIHFFYWRFYGPADREKFNRTKSIINSSESRAFEGYPPHSQFKSIVRTDSFFRYYGGPHEPILIGDNRVTVDSGFLNHYFYRTEDFFKEKIVRRKESFGYRRDSFDFHENIKRCSELKDVDDNFIGFKAIFNKIWIDYPIDSCKEASRTILDKIS
jgi:hypothetical protein